MQINAKYSKNQTICSKYKKIRLKNTPKLFPEKIAGQARAPAGKVADNHTACNSLLAGQ